LNHLSLVFVIGIVSPTAVEEHGDAFGRNPVGTGPFKFQEWVSNQSITLVRNEDYHGTKAYLDEVEFRVIPEEGARMIAYMRGDLDMLLRAAPAELELLRDDPSNVIAEAEGLRVVYIGLNHTMPPTDDQRVRQAITHAIDVDSINAFVVEDAMLPAQSVIATSVFGFEDTQLPERYAYNPERALELLAEAGYTRGADGILRDQNGQPLTLTFWASQGRDLKDREISETVMAQLSELGFEIDYSQREFGAYLSALGTEEPTYNLFTLGWVTMTGDGDFGLYSTFHSTVAASNYSLYNNPEVDRLLEEARVSLDQEVREEAYAQVLEHITEDVVWIPIYQTRETVVMKDYIKGYIPHPAEYYLRLDTVWLDR
jgi:peptide/nickel transport system substrate-binding protein